MKCKIDKKKLFCKILNKLKFRYSRCAANTEISDKQVLSVPIQSNDCTVKKLFKRMLGLK